MLDHDRPDVWVAQQSSDLAAGAVHARSDLGLHPDDPTACPRGPAGEPGVLPVEIGLLVVR